MKRNFVLAAVLGLMFVIMTIGVQSNNELDVDLKNDWTVLSGDLLSKPDPSSPTGVKLLRLLEVFAPDIDTDKGKKAKDHLKELIETYPDLGAIEFFSIPDRAVVSVTNFEPDGVINFLMQDYIKSLYDDEEETDTTENPNRSEDNEFEVLAGDLLSIKDSTSPTGIRLLRLAIVYAPDVGTENGEKCIAYLKSLIEKYPDLDFSTYFEIPDRSVVELLNTNILVDINQLMRVYIQSLY